MLGSCHQKHPGQTLPGVQRKRAGPALRNRLHLGASVAHLQAAKTELLTALLKLDTAWWTKADTCSCNKLMERKHHWPASRQQEATNLCAHCGWLTSFQGRATLACIFRHLVISKHTIGQKVGTQPRQAKPHQNQTERSRILVLSSTKANHLTLT